MLLWIALAALSLFSHTWGPSEVNAGIVEDKYSCPHGWTRYGGKKCLKYVNELQDYDRAQATCRSKNQGTLVTIHSHDEQNFVYSYIHSIAASSTPIWLGAKQIDFESILWLDKTENSYTNWAPNEPSHPDEICIAIHPRTGMWQDTMCTDLNVPACERAPTTQWPFFVAFCSEGWFQFNDEKCVRIISSQVLNFYEAQELCRSKYNSKLLSIKTDRESEFLHNLIKFRDVKSPVWLGAVQNDFSSFNWIDKSDVTFTNWADGEPNDPDHACLSMTASGGKWSDNDCKEQKLILCQKAVPEDSSCETGWLQFRQDKCYRFVHIRLAFDDAETLCNNLYAGHLPSIHSQEEQFMISQFLASVNVKNGSEIWLGGRQMDFHNFNWGDGSQFNYSYWEHGEPNFPAEKCIEMSWRNGRWNDINCRLKRAVLCERQVSSRHLIKPNLYQPTTCFESNCSTPALGSSSSAGNSVQSGTQLDQSLPGELTFDSLSNSSSAQSVDLSGGNSSVNSSVSLTNRTSESQPVEPTLRLPLDDKPIKVISSIMRQEHSTISIESALPINATLQEPGNGSFVHYNLPPPDHNVAGTVSFADSINVASPPRKQPPDEPQVVAVVDPKPSLAQQNNLKQVPLEDISTILERLRQANNNLTTGILFTQTASTALPSTLLAVDPTQASTTASTPTKPDEVASPASSTVSPNSQPPSTLATEAKPAS